MKNFVVKLILLAAILECGFDSKAIDNGFGVGVAGEISPNNPVNYPIIYFNTGVYGDYKFHYNKRIYANPGISIAYNQFYSDAYNTWVGDVLSKGYKPWFMTLSINHMIGYDLGCGCGIFTGPEMNIVVAKAHDNDNGERLGFEHPVNLAWNLGISKQFGNIEVKLMYIQHLTEMQKVYEYPFGFRLGLGYRF